LEYHPESIIKLPLLSSSLDLVRLGELSTNGRQIYYSGGGSEGARYKRGPIKRTDDHVPDERKAGLQSIQNRTMGEKIISKPSKTPPLNAFE